MTGVAGEDENPGDDGFELDRWGTRFARAKTEKTFRVWNLERSARSHRDVLYISVA